MTIEELQRNLARWDVQDVARDAMSRHTTDAADLNRSQLKAGLSSGGNKLRRYASTVYAAFKSGMNPSPGFGNPDLLLTGEFHQSIVAEVTAEEVAFRATDQKAGNLLSKYGDNILGLSVESCGTFADKIRDDFERITRQILGL
ncbi:MAG: hypothetical protein WC871_03610 [Bacteroidales bacterium]|jgi:hypothetical protein